MADIDLKTETPDTTLPATGFLFGADSQASASPSVYSTQAVATTLLGSTTLSGTTITADAPVLNLTQTWNNAAVTFTGMRFNVPTDTSNAASLLMDLQVGGSSKLSVRKNGLINFTNVGDTNFIAQNGTVALRTAYSGTVLYSSLRFESALGFAFNNNTFLIGKGGAGNLQLGAADAAAPVAQTLSVQSVVAGTTNTAGTNLTITGSQGTGTGAGGSLIFQVAPAGSSGSAQNGFQTVLQITGAGGLTGQDGATANTLALRNGTTAQTFNVYETFTDASNYSRLSLSYTASSDYSITADKAGTGSFRSLTFTTYGNATATVESETIKIRNDGRYSWTSTTTSRGTVDTYLKRMGVAIVGVRGSSDSVGASIEMVEQTAPAAPAANGVRIYAEDNGSGKTRLMAIFATGAAQQIAIEP